MKSTLVFCALFLGSLPALADDPWLSQFGLDGMQVVSPEVAAQVVGRGFTTLKPFSRERKSAEARQEARDARGQFRRRPLCCLIERLVTFFWGHSCCCAPGQTRQPALEHLPAPPGENQTSRADAEMWHPKSRQAIDMQSPT